MKKNWFLLLAFVCFSNLSYAQEKENKTSRLQFGVKAGVNYSNVYDAKAEAFVADAKYGVMAGAFITIPLGKYWGLQPELLYSQRGYKATGMLLGNAYSFTRTSSFIDVPILLAIKPSPFVSILIGPQYSFLSHQKDVFVLSEHSAAQEAQFNNDNIRKNILCITGGLDVQISRVNIGLRAGWDMQKNNGDGASTSPQYKNVWYQASIGFRIL
ncbi:MAG: hypothetical protein RLY16_2246 [Bacteroidota bacterium]|jgi:hypothetical protein